MKKLLTAVSLVVLATPFAQAQEMMGDYLDVLIVKVRPEKRADFDAVGRRKQPFRFLNTPKRCLQSSVAPRLIVEYGFQPFDTLRLEFAMPHQRPRTSIPTQHRIIVAGRP
jgi:hypothetical protein